jgi:hypothetical protein
MFVQKELAPDYITSMNNKIKKQTFGLPSKASLTHGASMSHKNNEYFDYVLLALCFTVLSLVWLFVWVLPNDARNLQISQCQLEKGDRSFEAYKACALKSQVNGY